MGGINRKTGPDLKRNETHGQEKTKKQQDEEIISGKPSARTWIPLLSERSPSQSVEEPKHASVQSPRHRADGAHQRSLRVGQNEEDEGCRDASPRLVHRQVKGVERGGKEEAGKGEEEGEVEGRVAEERENERGGGVAGLRLLLLLLLCWGWSHS